MVVNRRKKNTRNKSKTHGYGGKKMHKGSGNTGGYGMGGTGKRAQSKKPSIWAIPDYFGKHGFKMKGQIEAIFTINLKELDAKAEKLANENVIEKKGNVYHVNLDKLGYNKLLGSGKPRNKFEIDVKYASKNALARVQEAGGKVNLTDKEGQ